MKFARITLSLALLAAMPSSALASTYPPESNGKCLFIFPVKWAAYMYIPCQAGMFR